MNKKLFYLAFGLLAVILVAVVVSCDNSQYKKRGIDGYYFEKESFVRTEFPVKIRLVKSPEEMTQLLAQRKKQINGQVDPKKVAAFAVIREDDPTCTLYILDPKTNYQPEYIGHELVHCIYGTWHSEPQRP